MAEEHKFTTLLEAFLVLSSEHVSHSLFKRSSDGTALLNLTHLPSNPALVPLQLIMSVMLGRHGGSQLLCSIATPALL